MQSRIIPSLDQLEKSINVPSPGLITLVKFLDSHLRKDENGIDENNLENYNGWLIFIKPFLNGVRPDLIIFNPQVGVVIYNVKEWTENNIKEQNNIKNEYKPLSPDKQVTYYKSKLIGQLVPRIGEEFDKNKQKFGLIKTGLYFHNISTKISRDSYAFDDKIIKHFPLFGNDFLFESNLKEIVPNHDLDSSKYWVKEWNKDILFWLRSPYHSIEQGTLLELKGNQFKIAEPMPGHWRVRGVAGGGKTQALAYRAGKLASQGLNVLIISYNITLLHYIKDMIGRSPFNFSWDKLTFNHFHGFCKDLLNEFGRKWPKQAIQDDNDFFKVTVPNEVINSIKNKIYLKYDAILIDEGQDFHFEWYTLLDGYFLSERDELLIVSDKRQNIFNRKLDWLDKRVSNGLHKFNDRYIDLNISYRLPKRVIEIANDFSRKFSLNQDLDFKRIDDKNVLFHSHHIVWLNIDEKEWKDYIMNSYLRLKKEKQSPSDIVILLPNHRIGMECVNLFREINLDSNHVFSSGDKNLSKKSFYMGDGRIKMSTIHSFKGWELKNVIIFIPFSSSDHMSNIDSVIYTAITRTKANLIVINANIRYKEFGESLPKKWKDQN